MDIRPYEEDPTKVVALVGNTDIEPNPEWDKAVVTAYDWDDYNMIQAGRQLAAHTTVMRGLVAIRETFDDPHFPYDMILTRRQLGRIAGETLGQRYPYPDAAEIARVKQIFDFFEKQSRRIVPDGNLL